MIGETQDLKTQEARGKSGEGLSVIGGEERASRRSFGISASGGSAAVADAPLHFFGGHFAGGQKKSARWNSPRISQRALFSLASRFRPARVISPRRSDERVGLTVQ